MEKGSRKYGLIISSKKKQATKSVKQLSAFAESSSDDEKDGKQLKTGALWRENKKNAQKIKSRGQVTKALEEDPSVFEYDSIYDEMQEKKRKSDPRLVTKDRSSKYIANLKKVAERRKLEQDIIYERKVQREQEREGKQAEDQETFLTSAYRKKLEERRKLEEELKLEAYREEADDVTKQTDMSRFHRNLLERMTSDGASNKSEMDRRNSSGEQHTEKLVESERNVSQDALGDAITDDRDAEIDRGLGESDGSVSPKQQESQRSNVQAEFSPAPGASSAGNVSSNLKEATTEAAKEIELSKEEKRKKVSAKRTSEETMSSAKERYLARKRAKTSAPVISSDD